MFGVLKELIASRTPEKYCELNVIDPDDVVDMQKEVEDETDDEPVRSVKEELIEELVDITLNMKSMRN
ncbi:hypothetical protein Tco_0873177 [Tanacetum coccineum]